jgi:AmmeMemoRadiSam system protein B
MIASKIFGANSSKILNYKNSGDVSGDKSAVVGYLSAAFYKR